MDGYKPFHGAIICALNLGWKEAGRQFLEIPVIDDAFAAYSLARAWLVGTIAFSLIAVYLTVPHSNFPTLA
jgi:hypothetical protein